MFIFQDFPEVLFFMKVGLFYTFNTTRNYNRMAAEVETGATHLREVKSIIISNKSFFIILRFNDFKK